MIKLKEIAEMAGESAEEDEKTTREKDADRDKE